MKYLPILPAAAAAAGIVSCDTEPKQPDYVNFILINLDDAGNGDFSFSGALGYKTPNIDRLASQGSLFFQHYVQVPTSGASRASMLTGHFPKDKSRKLCSTIYEEMAIILSASER